MEDISNKKCIPCEGGVAPVSEENLSTYMKLVPEWRDFDNKKIYRDFEFKDFNESMEFVNKVADLAEEKGHHPDIHIFYNKVKIELYTHAINGLHENDFIIAVNIDKI